MNESYLYVIVALLPLTAAMVMLQSNPYQALVIRGVLGAIAALVYALLGAADVSLTEALMGTMLAVTLYAVAIRSSLVMRLGVIAEETDTVLEQLKTQLQTVLSKRFMRLELVAYSDKQALQQALMDKDIHAVCIRQDNLETIPYETTIRLPYLYDIFKNELTAANTILTCIETPKLEAAIAFAVKMVIIPNTASSVSSLEIVESLVRDGGVPNAVSVVIFRNRLYDTIYEVIVFTIAIMGANFLLATEKPASKIHQFTDQPSIILARLGATITALVGIELAIRGHLSPGGGFAAGVAGGTAIGLIAITSSPEWMQAIYRRWQAATWEKISVLVFIVLAAITLSGFELPHGELGALFSG
ncbi:MAG: DUF4040 domain-containing protein, partial [Microcystis aeruginosa K13-07]|nr:DUF4040 domain-containing protein [Microcystis aeruginosa K13-07]